MQRKSERNKHAYLDVLLRNYQVWRPAIAMHDGGGDQLLSVTVIVLGSHLNPVESNLDYANFGLVICTV